MATNSQQQSASETDPGTRPQTNEVVDWTDLGARMWSFLTGREAAINYTFNDMKVEIPRDTGANAPRAVWKVDGTLTVTTHDHDSPPTS